MVCLTKRTVDFSGRWPRTPPVKSMSKNSWSPTPSDRGCGRPAGGETQRVPAGQTGLSRPGAAQPSGFLENRSWALLHPFQRRQGQPAELRAAGRDRERCAFHFRERIGAALVYGPQRLSPFSGQRPQHGAGLDQCRPLFLLDAAPHALHPQRFCRRPRRRVSDPALDGGGISFRRASAGAQTGHRAPDHRRRVRYLPAGHHPGHPPLRRSVRPEHLVRCGAVPLFSAQGMGAYPVFGAAPPVRTAHRKDTGQTLSAPSGASDLMPCRPQGGRAHPALRQMREVPPHRGNAHRYGRRSLPLRVYRRPDGPMHEGTVRKRGLRPG